MSKKVEWKEKKTSLGSAIIMSVVMAVVGWIVGINWNQITLEWGPYLGVKSDGTSSSMDWSALNEVYNKLAVSYNGEIDKNAVIEGAKKGLVDALGDVYTTYMSAEKASD